jgi:hypothetical protein
MLINQVGKPTVLEACRNGIVSAFAGNCMVVNRNVGIIILVPRFSEDARDALMKLLNWFINILS